MFIFCRFVPLNREKPSVLSEFGVAKFLFDFVVQHSDSEYSLYVSMCSRCWRYRCFFVLFLWTKWFSMHLSAWGIFNCLICTFRKTLVFTDLKIEPKDGNNNNSSNISTVESSLTGLCSHISKTLLDDIFAAMICHWNKRLTCNLWLVCSEGYVYNSVSSIRIKTSKTVIFNNIFCWNAFIWKLWEKLNIYFGLSDFVESAITQ